MFSRFIVGFALAIFAIESQAASITATPIKGGEGVLFVEGEFLASDADEFRRKIAPYSGGIAVLISNGGDTLAGIQIGNTIRLRNFTTWVPTGTTCASACALAWLGGARRLMGNPALIGFHASSRVSDGAESGVGNAVVGKYLADLGLSYSAIAYVTSSRPDSMTWMTAEDAKKVGIEMAVFDPKEATPAKQPSVVRPPETAQPQLRRRTSKFVNDLYSIVSGPNDRVLPALDTMYADRVHYFGKTLSRAEVVEQQASFLERWPQRNYKPKEGSTEIVCDENAFTCRAKGVLDFDAKSLPRNQRSWGTATFEYVVAFTKDGTLKITLEGGSPIERQIGPLRLEPKPHGKD